MCFAAKQPELEEVAVPSSWLWVWEIRLRFGLPVHRPHYFAQQLAIERGWPYRFQMTGPLTAEKQYLVPD